MCSWGLSLTTLENALIYHKKDDTRVCDLGEYKEQSNLSLPLCMKSNTGTTGGFLSLENTAFYQSRCGRPHFTTIFHTPN